MAMADLRHRDVGAGNGGAGADAEVAPAVRAPVGHRLGAGNLAGLDAPALSADERPPAHSTLSGHSVAACSVGNMFINSMIGMPSRCARPGALCVPTM